MTTSDSTNDNELQQVVQWVTTSGTASGNEWQRAIAKENDWQQVVISAKFSFLNWVLKLLTSTCNY